MLARRFIALGLILLIIGITNLLVMRQHSNNMQITSDAFTDGQILPTKYTCDGNNINAPLNFSNIPAGTKSLALIYEDPDAPKSSRAPNGVWVHWLVWNIDPEKLSVSEGEQNFGTVGVNTGGGRTYESPCPPQGVHRYIYMLYALNSKLDHLPQTSTKSDLMSAMQGRILAEAALVGKYSRSN